MEVSAPEEVRMALQLGATPVVASGEELLSERR